MITLITGVPGAGKTLYAVSLIEKVLKSEPDRAIYSDIDGLNFGDSVTEFAADEDWRELPDGSLVFLDEVHRRWPASGKSGMANNPQINDLDTHRHRGFDFYLLTQYPTKLHFEVRTNVGEHLHVSRISGAPVATVFRWQGWQGSPNDKSERHLADKEVFRYPKRLYQRYKSATVHTHKFRIPLRLFQYAALVLIACSFVSYNLLFKDSALIGAFAGEAQASAVAQPADAAPLPSSSSPARAVTLAGCIGNDYQCRCYLSDGTPVDQSLQSCFAQLDAPLPFALAPAVSGQ